MKNPKTHFISVTPSSNSTEYDGADEILININEIVTVRECEGYSIIYYKKGYHIVKDSYNDIKDKLNQFKSSYRFTELTSYYSASSYDEFRVYIDLNSILYANISKIKLNRYKHFVYFNLGNNYNFILITEKKLTEI